MSPCCDLEDRIQKKNLHDILAHDDAPQYQVWLRKVA